MIIILICIAALLVGVALYKRDSATIRLWCVCSLLVVQAWLSLHYAVAYREVPVPSSTDLTQEQRRIWLAGSGAMTCYTLSTYVPTFGVFSISLAILALTPVRKVKP